MMFSIIIAKLVAYILRFFGKGATTLPGKVALSLKYNILNRLSKGVHIICVTGTNGKTTTCALIEQGLIEAGKSYFINKGGANMLTGVATSFIMNSNSFGKCKREYAILECDENSFPTISRFLDAEIVIVTNLFRDQLDRYGEIDITKNKIVEAINNMPDSVVLLNADCPITYSISKHIENEIITFGIDAKMSVNAVSDLNYCPRCNKPLSYSSRIYAQLGNYYCPHCDYSRPSLNYSISDAVELNENGSSFVIDNQLVRINLGGIYNLYNYLSAYSALAILGINDNKSLSDFGGSFGRMERFYFNDNEILLLLVKNPVGFSNCLSYAESLKGEYSYIFALNDNDADGRDISWIWDVNFNSVKLKATEISTIGKRAYDMALRLKYNDLRVDNIFDNEKYNLLIDHLKKSNKNTIIFSSYTAMMNMRGSLIKAFGGAQFWE